MPIHPFEIVCDSECRVLILGSFPSVRSRQEGFYYAHPRNRFWTTLAAVFSEVTPSKTEDRKAFLLRHHIALWDAAYSCDIQASSDATMRHVVPTDLNQIFDQAQIELVLLNGGQAGKIYERCQANRFNVPYQIMPSTSPANAACSQEKLISCWGKALRQVLEKE